MVMGCGGDGYLGMVLPRVLHVHTVPVIALDHLDIMHKETLITLALLLSGILPVDLSLSRTLPVARAPAFSLTLHMQTKRV